MTNTNSNQNTNSSQSIKNPQGVEPSAQAGGVALAEGSAELAALMQLPVEEVAAENARRLQRVRSPYDPLTGEGCYGERELMAVSGYDTPLYLPSALVEALGREAVEAGGDRLKRERIKYDFEYWCATCTTIVNKLKSRLEPLVPNVPQRRLIAVMEGARQAGEPVRVLLLKARQWGGSTLVQLYMAWLQLVVRANWNSVIIGHLRQSAAAIKGMYTRLLSRYPREMSGGERPRFESFEGAANVNRLMPSDSLVIIGSALSEDAVRGYDLKLAHLSEVAFWKQSTMHRPEDVIRAVMGTVPRLRDTVVVMESTADGVGSFFHTQWTQAITGLTGYTPLFVPWHEIEIYREPVADVAALWRSLDAYEYGLWQQGLTLEQINWYHNKRREYSDLRQMHAEFPGTAAEAFSTSGFDVFAIDAIERLRDRCHAPLWRGEIVGERRSLRSTLVENSNGLLSIWAMPEPSEHTDEPSSFRYVVTVDIGGRSAQSDYSVICVVDRFSHYGMPEVVAQWRGHIDHDLLAWKAAQLGAMYGRAKLAIESNTLETHCNAGIDGKALMREVANAYGSRFYFRKMYDPLADSPAKPGVHTNVRTKNEMIMKLVARVRDATYVEHDTMALDEMATYYQPAGKKGFEARPGKHDDILMTRAIAMLVLDESGERAERTRRNETVSFFCPWK